MFFKKINMRLVSVLCLVVLILTSVDQAHAGVFTPTVLPFAPEAESVTSTVAASSSGANPTPRDIMLVIDTTLAMAYATSGSANSLNYGDDPRACNAAHTCQPFEMIRSAAIDYLDLLSFPYDRVGIVTMTGQTPGGTREPVVVLPLTDDKATVQTALSNLKVFQPPVCVRELPWVGQWMSPSKGICLEYDNNGVFIGTNRPIYLGGADLDENTLADNLHDPTTLGASNIGGTLNYANDVLEQSARNDASLIVILLDSGPANATSIDDALNYPDGFCPQNTWNTPYTPNCRDSDLAADHVTPLITRHNYGNPNYDADDYARDAADVLAAQQAGTGITVHTIGVGTETGLPNLLRNAPIGLPASGENLLTYIAHQTDDGQYYYAEDPINLPAIFADIAGVVTDPNGRYVSPTGSDTSPTTCNSPLAPCLTINKAIQSAVAGNTVYVAEGTYTSASGSYVVSLNKSLTLSGGWDNAYANQIGFSTIDGQNTRQGISVAAVSTIDHFVVQNGFTSSNGGGFFVNSAVTINHSLITDNYAAVGGGGIYGVGNITLNNSTVENNSAERGAGIDLYSLNSLTLNNSTIGGNQATNLGGGIYMNGISGSGTANITIQNSTITNNSALTGGGIYSGGSSPRRNLTITNSILSGNTATTGGDCAGAGITPVSSSNHNILGNLSNCGIMAGTGDLVGVDPQLADFPVGDLHYYELKYTSPAIDAGDSCLPADQRDTTRPQGGACDIGAFEFDFGNGPLINVKGNGLSIVNNDVTPSISDYTDFGVMDVSTGLVDRSFTIENNGRTALNLTGTPTISISGANASDFSVTANPVTPVFAGGFTNFTVHFDPSGGGVRTATISIVSDDTYRTSYDFSIQGTGSVPELIVTNTSDSGDGVCDSNCSLREAILMAQNGTVISFSPSLSDAIIYTSGMNLTKNVIIDASNLVLPLTLDAGDLYRHFQVASGATVIIRNIILTNGSYNGLGGSINNQGVLTLDRVVVSSSSASSFGGGIYNTGELTVLNSTFKDNQTFSASGGAIYNTGPMAIVKNSTFNTNQALEGGGIFSNTSLVVENSTFYFNGTSGLHSVGPLTVKNSTFSQNGGFGIKMYGNYSTGSNTSIAKIYNTILANNGSNDCYNSGAIIDTFVGNLVETGSCGTPVTSSDPQLGSLTNNGGSTQTLALLSGSPAINTGDDASCLATDQRGIIRPQGLHCDIGALEYVDSTPPIVNSIVRVGASPTLAGNVDFTVTFSEPVTSVDTGDFSLTTTGVTGSSITGVTGTGSAYNVSVNTGSGDGTIRLDIPSTATIVDSLGHSLDGLPYLSGQSYTIDKAGPLVSAINYYNVNPTYFSNIQFNVSFSNAVNGVDIGDFALTTTGITGATITNVTGSLSSYTVYVNTGTGDGTIRVDVPATATITDGVGNPIGNLPFTNGKVIQIARADQSTDAAFLDGSFGNNGRVIPDFGKNAIGQSAVLQPDGKILVAGAIETANMNSNVLLARYNVDGSTDASFGINGFVSVGAGETSKDITLQSDGKIVVLALLWDNGISSIVLSRYTSNGDLDTTFGVNGLVSMDFPGVENGSSVIVQEDGKILVAGNRPEANGSGSDLFLLRYNENGTLDSTFNADGIVVSNFGAVEYSSDAVLQIDNKILVVGVRGPANSSSKDLLLTRYNSDGSLDTSFGANGLVVADFGANESGNSVALQLDGKIVVSGTRYIVAGSSMYKYLLARFNSDGSLDNGFGTNGQSFVDFTSTILTSDVGLQPDGNIVMLGNSNDNFVLYRFDGSGILNSNYGTDGYTITDFGKQDIGYQLLIQPDGKPLAVGLSVDNEIYSNKLVMARYKSLDNPPMVLQSERVSPDPTAAASVEYNITFSEAVTGVDKDDFTLTTSGVTGTSITTVTGSGSNYTVKVNTGSGNGTIRLDVKHDDGIVDGGLNPMVASFTSGEVYTVAKTSSLLVSPTNDGYLASVTPAFTWKTITGALEYQLEVDKTEWFDAPEVHQSQPSGTTFTSPVLDYGIHYWRMRVRTSGGWGVWTAGWKFTLTPTLPAAPTLASPASAAVLTDNTPLLTWNMVLADDRYEVQIDNLNTFASPEQTFTSGLGVLSYTAATLPDGVWNWRVRAINYLNLPGAWSISRSFTVDTVGPLAPVLNAPTNDATVIGTPAFSWTATSTASKYQFEYDSDADFSSPAYTSTELTATSHTPPAMPLGSYSWHVRAKDAAGNWSVWSAARVVTILSQIPVAPTLSTPANAFATNDSTPEFSWLAVASGETYQLEISSATTFATKQQTFSGAPGVLTYTATTIPDGLWYWHVRAVNVNGVAGAWSAYRSFTIDTTAPVTSPTLSAPANAASVIGTPSFSWGSVATATKYEFQYDNDADFSSPVYTSAELTTLNHTPPAMVLGTYSWRVRARDAVGNWSAWSATRTVTILPPVPVAPVLTSPANALVTTDATPDFVWASVVSGDTYQLEISNATTFATKQQTFSGASGVLTYTATTIPDGLWYWHVRALNVNGVAGPWSAYRSFTVDTTGPVAPALSAPANVAAVIGTPAFSWTAAATASKYQFEYDNDADFSSPVYTSAELTTTSHTPPTMVLGTYSWHVRAKDAAGNWGLWSTARTVTILPLVPVAPTLTTPVNAFVTNDSTPDFIWISVPSGETYQLEISNATTFATKQQTFTGATGILTYTATTIPDGLWYWHVRAVNVNGVVGTWSAYRSFTMDTNGPSAPTLSAPANAATVTGTPAFSWAATTSAVKYQFEYDNDADFSSPLYTSGELTTTSHTPPAMSLGSYSWHVRAKDAAGNWGPWSLTRVVTIQPLVPVAPALTIPAASAVTNDSTPDFVWASVVSGGTYQLEISNATTFATKQQTFSGAPGVLTYTATNIPDGLWYWHVRAVNVNGVAGAWSAYRSFTVDTTAPVAPTLSSPANAASVIGTAAFSWTSVATASKYQFEYDNDADLSSPVYTSAELTTTSYTPPAMSLGAYSWHVRAKDAAGNWSAWSAARTVTILSNIPVAPMLTAPVASAVTNDSTLDFTWASVVSGDTYQLEISNATTFAAKQQTFSGAPGVLTYTATTIPDGVWYWHVRAVNVNGTAGPWSAYRSFTVDTVAPVAPTLNSPANAASVSGTPAFSWASVATAAKYQFEYDNDADFSSPVYTSADLTTTSHTPPSIVQGVYSWHVRAKDAAGNWGPWSTARTVTVFPLVPATPTLVSPVYGTLSRDPIVTLVWSAMANAVRYQVLVDDNSTFSSPEFDISTPDTSIATVLLPDGTYYWRVRQTDILGGVSLWSASWRITISRPVPTAPTTDTPLILTGSATPAFEWNNVPYGVDYQIQVDTDSNFSSPLADDTADTLNNIFAVPFASGQYFWRVRAISEYGIIGPWSTTWTLNVELIPAAPTLLSPDDFITEVDGSVFFSWQSLPEAETYQIQVDTASFFDSPIFDNTAPQTTRELVGPLTDGGYYWRVRGINALGTPGEWSEVRLFLMSIPPATPTLLTPEADSTNADGLPTLSWEAVAGSYSYEIQVDDNANFNSPIYSNFVSSSIREVALTLGNGTYYWRIRAVNIMSKSGAWSEVWTFTVDVPIGYP